MFRAEFPNQLKNHDAVHFFRELKGMQSREKSKSVNDKSVFSPAQMFSGLIMLIGIIMYISMFKSEIGSKLRPRSMFQPPLFTYRYGHSFILFVIGCISAEIVGTLNFFLFIQIREIGREKVRSIETISFWSG